MSRFDVIVLGAGMAGASLAAELARTQRVLIVETEDQPGRHATGRSAAMFFESYGNATVRALTRASHRFLADPPAGFCDTPLLTPRGALFVADVGRVAQLEALLAAPDAPTSMQFVDAAGLMRQVPILNPEWAHAGALDNSGHEIDVHALHQGFLRAARAAGAQLMLDARDMHLESSAGRWRLYCRQGSAEAAVVVNATGAWADEVAVLAGARPLGLQPLRRSAMTLAAPAGHDVRAWPMVIDIDEQFYFKPDAGQLLLSPANEDLSPPCDAAPDEWDVAVAVDRFERATTIKVSRITHRWAGLRTFASDRSPVVGFDRDAPGFFWLAGQGGAGIQTAPAMARGAAALITTGQLPADLQDQGLDSAALSPQRFSNETYRSHSLEGEARP